MRKFLIGAIVVLSLILAALLGFIWYESTHVFVDGEAYAKYEEVLDLREEQVSESHYLAVQAQLPDTQIIWNVPFQNGNASSDAEHLSISTLKEEDIRILETYFPRLKSIDASACRDYALLGQLALAMPECDVSYQVDLGGVSGDPSARELTLEAGGFEFDTLLENLIYLPRLEAIYFPKTDLTQDQQQALAEQFPEIAVSCTVELLGKEYDMQTTSLDLSDMTSADVDDVAVKLGVLPELDTVQLMDASNVSRLTLEDVQKLKLAAPEAQFQYSFDFHGITISTMDEEVILRNITVENDNFADELRMVLDVLENCDRLVLESRGQYDKLWQKITSEELAQIREEYRDKTKLVWRVYFGDNGSSLTDVEVIRAVYGLVDDNSSALKYLEDCRYMDIGHNEALDYCDFVSGMVSLEAVIISGAPIKSLEPFRACKNLKFLEIVECHYIPDLEPLRDCTQLEMLNISHTEIADISPLEEIKLTHLNTINNEVPDESIEAYGEENPDCWIVTKGNHYGEGWRYDEDGGLLPWYAKLDAEYHYISQRNIPNNMGWYLPDEA